MDPGLEVGEAVVGLGADEGEPNAEDLAGREGPDPVGVGGVELIEEVGDAHLLEHGQEDRDVIDSFDAKLILSGDGVHPLNLCQPAILTIPSPGKRMGSIRLVPGEGPQRAYARAARCRCRPGAKGRTFWVHTEKRVVHNVVRSHSRFPRKKSRRQAEWGKCRRC